MDSAFRIHVQEITDQLNSIVIKFTPFVEMFNNKAEYLLISGFDEYNPATFPYYRILAGDAAFATEDLYCYSPKLKTEILLTRDNVIAYPDIVIFYRNQSNLKSLLNRYPNDQFLIRRIINPVKDISKAIAATNLTVLETQYSEVFFNQYEYADLMIFMQEILWRIDYRWYISPLEYEDLYPSAFYAMVWSVLPVLMLTKRMLNIKTINVHPFHIWEYLTSLGFGGYRGYLTHDQELFLYRNALYLKFHAGKKFLLDILEEVFLYPLKYNLIKKVIIDHTADREETHDKLPDVVPSTGSVDDYLSSTNFDSFLQDIYDGGHDTRNDTTYRQDVTDLFSKSSTNKLNTKFLEFDRNIDMSEMMILLKFILDETAYLITQNKLFFTVDVQSPISQNIIQFDNTTDAMSLLFYCMYMRTETPTIPFRFHTSTTAITHLSSPEIPQYVYVNGDQYYIRSYVDVDSIVSEFPYATDDIYSEKDLSTQLGLMYVWLFGMINKLATITDTVEHEAHVAVFRALIPEIEVLSIDQAYASYSEFFNKYPNALAEISRISDDDQYGEFMYAIISGICPLEYGFAALARDDEIISILIHKIKELFTYMVSYNITFLNKVYESSENMELPKISMHLDVGVAGDNPYDEYIGSLFTLDDMYNSSNYYITISSSDSLLLDIDFDVDVSCYDTIFNDQMHIEQGTDSLYDITESTDITIYAVHDGISLELSIN